MPKTITVDRKRLEKILVVFRAHVFCEYCPLHEKCVSIDLVQCRDQLLQALEVKEGTKC
jgi:hypothetical protein